MDGPMKKAPAALTARTPPQPTTLLDVHEVEWVTRELERLLAKERMSGRDDDGDAGADDAGRHRRRTKRARATPEPKKGGFFAELLGRHAVSICSGDAAAAGDGGRRPRGRRSGFREVVEENA